MSRRSKKALDKTEVKPEKSYGPNERLTDAPVRKELENTFNRAVSLITQGEREVAAKLFVKILVEQPDHWRAINNLAGIRAMAGDPTAAELFKRVVEIFPGYEKGWVNLGISLQAHGRFDESAEAFQQALLRNPNLEAAAVCLAKLRAGQKSPKIVLQYANVRNDGETERVTSLPSEWGQKKINSILPVYYDLSQAPTTFDAAMFFAIASGYAQLKNYDAMDITIIASSYRLASKRDLTTDSASRDWRLWNILFRLATLIPRVRNITVQRNGKLVLPTVFYPENPVPGGAGVFVDQYPMLARTFLDGADVQVYRPSRRALQWAQGQFTKPDRSIVLSIRNVGPNDERNANIQDWLHLYQHLTNKGFDVVVIPDQNDALGDGAGIDLGWKLALPAAVDLDLRLALYNSCRMNFSWAGGQSLLLWLSPAPFRIFGLLNEKSMTTADYFAQVGPAVGSQPPFFQFNQRILWEDAAEISAEFLVAAAEKALLESDI
ncbi:MAG: tetratricopeptide repeat protein [Betaproteobacteria bacterium]|nr:tetratricopeptide repeat protein [Betaproteobacteria bacterium]